MLYPLSYEGIAHRSNLGPFFGTFEILRARTIQCYRLTLLGPSRRNLSTASRPSSPICQLTRYPRSQLDFTSDEGQLFRTTIGERVLLRNTPA